MQSNKGGVGVMEYVKRLDEVGKNDIPLAGGKGANLGEMFHAGFPVPDGFCVTSNTYDLFIKENNFEEVIEKYINRIYSHENEAHKLCEELMEIISKGKLPRKVQDEIKEAYNNLGYKVRVAVRSSATAEDLPEASFAGQQETYLNIKGEEELLKTIKKCLASLWTERAVLYRKETGFDKVKVSLAIVVQIMIEGDISGVLFTVNPTNKNYNQMMINASYGLGEAIVSGTVTPDTLIWNRSDKKIENKILGTKEVSIVYGENGGVIQKENCEEKKKVICINDEQAEKLVNIGARIEKHYGYPQDIEWAIKNGTIYILQSRGITTLKNDSNVSKSKEDKKAGYSEVEKRIINNLIEHYPNPLYPLEVEAFNIVSEGKIKVFNELLGVKMNTQLKMTHDGEVIFDTSSAHLSLRIFEVPFKIKNIIDYSNNKKCTTESFKRLNKELSHIEEKIVGNSYKSNRVSLKTYTISQLMKWVNKIMEITEEIVYIRFRYNIFPNVVVNKLIHSKLKKVNRGITEYDLLSNLEYKTWSMNKAIDNLVDIICSDSKLKETIIDLKDISNEKLENILESLAESNEEFGESYHSLLKDFGWKCGNSYEPFSTVSWNEDKRGLISLLQATMTGNNEKEGNNKYKEICESIQNQFSKRAADSLFKRIEQIRNYHINREESLYMLERCYGLLRYIVVEISTRFPRVFKNKDDILYLFLSEVYKLNNIEDEEYYIKQINIRKEFRKKNKMLWDNCELNNEGDFKNIIKGISGNEGRALGRVCIINEIAEFSKLKEGDILVCRYTDPSWTPLFSIAAAVVSDTGGPLSHSAIVAREYNIPAVLGCGNASKILRDGQNVIVDGNKGIVLLKNN